MFYERYNRILCKMNMGMLRGLRLRILDTRRYVERLKHVACDEQTRNNVEGDSHLAETASKHLDEGVADETECHTFCDVIGQDHGEHGDEARKSLRDVEEIHVFN